MGTRQILLTLLFGVHWVAFVILLVRRKQLSLLLPIAVFTLLVLTQVLWTSDVQVAFGPFGTSPLPKVLRLAAIILAVPSVGLMVRRILARRRSAAGVGPPGEQT